VDVVVECSFEGVVGADGIAAGLAEFHIAVAMEFYLGLVVGSFEVVVVDVKAASSERVFGPLGL
jgi:hypothetical protein